MKLVLKRSLASVMALLMLLGVVLGMVACGPETPPEPTPCTHEWSEWTVTVEPTLEAAGEESRTCSLCTETETREVAKLEPCSHKWSKWETTVEATLESEGEQKRTCSLCGETETRKTDKVDPDTILMTPIDKEYDRGDIAWDEFTYEEPDFEAMGARLDAAVAALNENSKSYEEIEDMIWEIDDDAGLLMTANSYANIQVSLNNKDPYWTAEYERISLAYSGIVQKFEKLYIAAANSTLVDQLAENVFGDWIYDYQNEEGMSDELVALLEQESAMETRYETLSTATVEITYSGMTDTVDNILAWAAETYGESSAQYKQVKKDCAALYEAESKVIKRQLLVDLFKIRKLIANEQGLDNYLPYAYQSIGHDYSVEDAEIFFKAVGDYINVITVELESYFEDFYVRNSVSGSLSREKMLNVAYRVLGNINPDYQDIYNYMLLSGMYSVERKASGRDTGAFVTWLTNFDSPYLFVTMEGKPTDYSTLFHEFGHFIDYYINGDSAGIDMAEISSQALEFMFVSYMGDEISAKNAKFMTVAAIQSSLDVFGFQVFLAAFEHEAYKLEYDEITAAALDQCAARAAATVKFNLGQASSGGYLIDKFTHVPHIYLYPCYVQSYATSMTAALTIYRLEVEEPGAGLDAYIEFIDREDEDAAAEEAGIEPTFKYYLEQAGIPSPFVSENIKDLANFIYNLCKGKDYFE